jgi:hypothetical protein
LVNAFDNERIRHEFGASTDPNGTPTSCVHPVLARAAPKSHTSSEPRSPRNDGLSGDPEASGGIGRSRGWTCAVGDLLILA